MKLLREMARQIGNDPMIVLPKLAEQSGMSDIEIRAKRARPGETKYVITCALCSDSTANKFQKAVTEYFGKLIHVVAWHSADFPRARYEITVITVPK